MTESPLIESMVTILVAEDDPDDRLFVEEAFAENGFDGLLEFVDDGELLLQRLRRPDAPRPALVLMDLNMPRVNGFEALEQLRADASFLELPVLVLSTSRSDEDVRRAYRLGANAFLAKPTSFGELVETIRRLLAFWLQLARLPVHCEVR